MPFIIDYIHLRYSENNLASRAVLGYIDAIKYYILFCE